MLWPAFHYRLDLVKFQRESYEGYMRVNALLADKLLPLIEEDGSYGSRLSSAALRPVAEAGCE